MKQGLEMSVSGALGVSRCSGGLLWFPPAGARDEHVGPSVPLAVVVASYMVSHQLCSCCFCISLRDDVYFCFPLLQHSQRDNQI